MYLTINSSEATDKRTVAILYLDETMTIIDEYILYNYDQFKNSLCSSAKKLKPDTILATDEFIPQLTGTLIEKRIKTNSNQLEFSISEQFLEHFDILIANIEFKLVIKLDDKAGPVVTVYYDTRFLLYPICILPGMRVTVFNLIKRNSNIYKSNSMVCPEFFQDFNFLLLENEKDEYSMLTTIQSPYKKQEKKSLLENLKELDTIFGSFYEVGSGVSMTTDDSREIEAETRLNLLFRNRSTKEGNTLKIMAQLIKIYDLVLRVKCKICLQLPSSCYCSNKNPKEYANDL